MNIVGETYKHIHEVQSNINKVIVSLLDRGKNHDASKLESPEKEIFDRYTPMLKETVYGSDRYKELLLEIKVALTHHYKVNEHHPEYNPDGIKGMSLIDLVEMLCDWKAATLRHKNGNILESIEINQKRFGYSDELKQIFINTIKEL